MDTVTTRTGMLLDPIDPEWTIAQLLDWLGDDSRQHDDALRHRLAVIEAALTGAPWSATPSTVALIRSIADAARRTPSFRRIRISSLAQHRRSDPSPLAPDARLGEVRLPRPLSANPAEASAFGRAERTPQHTERNAQVA